MKAVSIGIQAKKIQTDEHTVLGTVITIIQAKDKDATVINKQIELSSLLFRQRKTYGNQQ